MRRAVGCRHRHHNLTYGTTFLLNTMIGELSLQRNLLAGTFLPEVEGLHSLKRLDLSHNQLQGELPGVFERLRGLGENAATLMSVIAA